MWFYFSCSSSSFISSSSSLAMCFDMIHPGASFYFLPQHHHIFSPKVDRCVRQDQLKFYFSMNSFWHFLHVFSSRSIFSFHVFNFMIFIFSLSRSCLYWSRSFLSFSASNLISASYLSFKMILFSSSSTFKFILMANHFHSLSINAFRLTIEYNSDLNFSLSFTSYPISKIYF